jgi:ribonuclease HI
MLITMFSDVSVSSERKIGTYAIWAKTNGQTFRHIGAFRFPVSDSNLAETMAIVNGLYFVIRNFNPPPQSKIIAQTDSGCAIGVLTGRIGNHMFAGAVERRDALLRGNAIEVEYRLIKGHSGRGTPRDAVNHWCDIECRSLLREMLRVSNS